MAKAKGKKKSDVNDSVDVSPTEFLVDPISSDSNHEVAMSELVKESVKSSSQESDLAKHPKFDKFKK